MFDWESIEIKEIVSQRVIGLWPEEITAFVVFVNCSIVLLYHCVIVPSVDCSMIPGICLVICDLCLVINSLSGPYSCDILSAYLYNLHYAQEKN